MATTSFWDRYTSRRVSRRRALQAAALTGAAAGAVAIVGCGGDDDDGDGTPSAGTTPGRQRRRRNRRDAPRHRQPGAGQGPAQGGDVPHARARVVLVQPAHALQDAASASCRRTSGTRRSRRSRRASRTRTRLTYIFTLRPRREVPQRPAGERPAAERRRRRLLVQPLPRDLAQQGEPRDGRHASRRRPTRRR